MFEENREILSTLMLKSVEVDAILKNNAILKEINNNLKKRDKVNREERKLLKKFKKWCLLEINYCTKKNETLLECTGKLID